MVNGRLLTESASTLEVSDFTIYWHGFVYIEGHPGQHESMERLAQRLTTHPVEDAVSVLKGCFFCLIHYTDDSYHAFVDNSGMFAAYESDDGVSCSFLKLVHELNLGIEDIDWTNVAEFLQTSNLYFKRTLFASIKKIGFDQILQFSPIDHRCVRLKKNVPDISDVPAHSSLQHSFEGLATALKGTRVSVDVTGGLDTRMLIAALHAADIEFDTAVSGDDDHADVKIAGDVAESIERPLFVSAHDISSLAEDLNDTIESLDGLKAHLLTQHRIVQLQESRIQQGVQLCLRGVGGEQFRDFKWAQDFPFYRSKKTRLERFDRLRVEVIRVPAALFTDGFKARLNDARIRRLENYEIYKRVLNTQSYDQIDCKETLQSSHSRSMSVSAKAPMAVYCPLSEIFRLQHAYHCPRSTRFGAIFQKHFITTSSRALAKVMTTYGATASTEPFYLITGSMKLFWTNTKRLIRKLSQTYIGKSPFILVTATKSGSMAALRQSPVCKESLLALKRHDILPDTLKEEEISDRFIERFICLGWLLVKLERKHQ